jgi:hypothetical protein
VVPDSRLSSMGTETSACAEPRSTSTSDRLNCERQGSSNWNTTPPAKGPPALVVP